MQIFNEINQNKNLSLALGFFDGVHAGHRAVMKSAVNYAKLHNSKSAVITFSEHPCCYFWGVKPKYILTRQEREKQIEALGIDYLYELNFEEISGLTAQDYLKDVLINHFTPISISTGWNHNFGCKKSGDVKFLRENSKKYDYEYFEIPAIKVDNTVVSSTKIRSFLSQGNLEKANLMLKRNFTISQEVVKGNQIGRTIGFNTANLVYPSELIELPYGVYTVQTQYGKGIANFGVRPTVNGSNAIVEVHILDFDKDIYGEILNVQFLKMLRKERKFASLEELKKQIQIDIKQI